MSDDLGAIVPLFNDEPALLSRVLFGVDSALKSGGRRPVNFLVGSAISAPAVPGVAATIERVRSELGFQGSGFESVLKASAGSNPYQRAFAVLQSRRGPDECNAVVRRCVLEAYGRSLEDIEPPALQWAESDNQNWKLPAACQTLGEIAARWAPYIAGTVLTTNFDPLLSIAIHRAGGSTRHSAIDSDGDFAQSGGKGAHVVHLHGRWDASDCLHTHVQLGTKRPRLHGSLKRIIGDSTLVVLGYGGWDDAITRALASIAEEGGRPDVVWAFYEKDPHKIVDSNRSLFRALDPLLLKSRLTLYSGIDAHQFLPRLLGKLETDVKLQSSACAPGLPPARQKTRNDQATPTPVPPEPPRVLPPVPAEPPSSDYHLTFETRWNGHELKAQANRPITTKFTLYVDGQRLVGAERLWSASLAAAASTLFARKSVVWRIAAIHQGHTLGADFVTTFATQTIVFLVDGKPIV